MSDQTSKISEHWNSQYESGKYLEEKIHPEVYQFLAEYILLGNATVLDQIKILEIGSGNGRNLVPIAEMGFQTFGIDVSDTGTDQSLKKLIQKGIHARVIYGDFRELPWKNEFFNTVIAFNVLQHGDFNDCWLAINDMTRVLKKNGIAFISVRSSKRKLPNDALVYQDNSLDGVSFIPQKTDKVGLILHHWGEMEINLICQENGLEILKKEEYLKPQKEIDTTIEKWHWNVVLQKK